MSGPLIEDILKVINMVVGEEAALPTSHYYFRKLFKPNGVMLIHFYCQTCEVYLGEKSYFDGKMVIPCPNSPEKTCNVSEMSGNIFITFSVREQVEYVATKPGLKWLSRDRRQEGVDSDVIDGELYQKICQPSELLENVNSMTLTFNTDGAQIFRSAQGSLWPATN